MNNRKNSSDAFLNKLRLMNIINEQTTKDSENESLISAQSAAKYYASVEPDEIDIENEFLYDLKDGDKIDPASKYKIHHSLSKNQKFVKALVKYFYNLKKKDPDKYESLVNSPEVTEALSDTGLSRLEPSPKYSKAVSVAMGPPAGRARVAPLAYIEEEKDYFVNYDADVKMYPHDLTETSKAILENYQSQLKSVDPRDTVLAGVQKDVMNIIDRVFGNSTYKSFTNIHQLDGRDVKLDDIEPELRDDRHEREEGDTDKDIHKSFTSKITHVPSPAEEKDIVGKLKAHQDRFYDTKDPVDRNKDGVDIGKATEDRLTGYQIDKIKDRESDEDIVRNIGVKTDLNLKKTLFDSEIYEYEELGVISPYDDVDDVFRKVMAYLRDLDKNETVNESIRSKASMAKDKVKAGATKVDKAAEFFHKKVNRLKEEYDRKRKEESVDKVLKDSIPILRTLRNAIRIAPIAVISPGVALMVAITLFFVNKSTDKKQRAEFIGDLKLEIKLLEDKINQADSKGDHKVKEQLIRDKDKLERALEKLQKNIAWQR